MPPVDLYKIGEVYFVRDGHHRVSVARALGNDVIDARVHEVITRVGAGRDLARADLPLKSHERVFHDASCGAPSRVGAAAATSPPRQVPLDADGAAVHEAVERDDA